MLCFEQLLRGEIETELIRRSWPFARITVGVIGNDPVPVIVFPSGGLALVVLSPGELAEARGTGSIASVIRRVLDEIEVAILTEKAESVVFQ